MLTYGALALDIISNMVLKLWGRGSPKCYYYYFSNIVVNNLKISFKRNQRCCKNGAVQISIFRIKNTRMLIAKITIRGSTHIHQLHFPVNFVLNLNLAIMNNIKFMHELVQQNKAKISKISNFVTLMYLLKKKLSHSNIC